MTTTPNSPGQTPQGAPQDPNKLKETLKDIIESQQDLSGIIRSILKDLTKTENAYGKIEASLDRITKGAIDVKGVQRELNKLIDREFIINKTNEELKKNASQQSKNLLKEAKEAARLSVEEAIALGKKRDYNEELLAYLEASEDHQALELFYAEQALKLATKRRQEGEQTLKTEKELANSLGSSGKLLKKFADQFGLGSEVYEELSRKQRNAGDNYSKLGVVFKIIGAAAKEALLDPLTYIYAAYKAVSGGLNLMKQGLDSLTGTGGPIANFVSPFTGLIKQIPLIGGLLGGILDAFANLMDLAMGTQSETQKFARNLGISFEQAKKLTDEFDEFARVSGQAYITIEKLRKSQTELSEALGINNILSKEILAADSQLVEQAGLDLETRKQLAAVTGITGVLQTRIFATVAAQNKVLSDNLGINIRVQDTIKKASSFGGVLGLTFAKYPESLTKSLMITKALGTDLEKMNSVASGLLNFEDSISKEFEAQLLTGKNMNLMKARELALNNKLAELAVELNTQLGTSEEFLKSNRLIQEAYADATHMSRDEIADMLKQQELFAKAGATDLKTYRERIAQMEKAGSLQRDFISLLSEEDAQNFLRSTALEKIASFMDKIKQGFANLLNNPEFKSFIDKIMTSLQDPNFINGIINKIATFVSLLLHAVAGIVDAADVAANVLSFGTVDISNKIPGQLRAMANKMGSVSLSTNVMRNQNTGGTGQGGSGNSGGYGAPVINLYADTAVKDHLSDAKVRFSMAPMPEQPTGRIGQ